jgi:hypothetical protein
MSDLFANCVLKPWVTKFAWLPVQLFDGKYVWLKHYDLLQLNLWDGKLIVSTWACKQEDRWLTMRVALNQIRHFGRSL